MKKSTPKKKKHVARSVTTRDDPPPPIIIDNGGSGRISQNTIPHDGLTKANNKDFVTGAFNGGGVVDSSSSTPIPAVAGGQPTKMIEVSFTGSPRETVKLTDNNDGTWEIKTTPPISTKDVGLFGQHVYQFAANDIDEVRFYNPCVNKITVNPGPSTVTLKFK